MRAMVLAAGRGRRMGALTRRCPKPLLRAGGLALAERLLLALSQAGFREVVMNTAYRGGQLEAALGDGRRYGLRLRFVREGAYADGAGLETGGGILHALPLLGPGPFLAVNADLHTDYPFARLRELGRSLPPQRWGHLVLVDNPPHRPEGDFALEGGLVRPEGTSRLTFSGIGLYRAALLGAAVPRPLRVGRPPSFPLAPVLREAAARGRLGGERYGGRWLDVGTPARLGALRRLLEGEPTASPPRAAG